MWGFLPDMMHNCSQANAYFLIISDGKYPEFQHFLYENIRFSSGGSGRVFRLVRRTDIYNLYNKKPPQNAGGYLFKTTYFALLKPFQINAAKAAPINGPTTNTHNWDKA